MLLARVLHMQISLTAFCVRVRDVPNALTGALTPVRAIFNARFALLTAQLKHIRNP